MTTICPKNMGPFLLVYNTLPGMFPDCRKCNNTRRCNLDAIRSSKQQGLVSDHGKTVQGTRKEVVKEQNGAIMGRTERKWVGQRADQVHEDGDFASAAPANIECPSWA